MSQQVVVENLKNLSKQIPIEKIQMFDYDIFLLVKGSVHKSMRESFPDIVGDEWEKDQ